MTNINWEMVEKKFENKVNLYRALGYRMVAFDMPADGGWIMAFDTKGKEVSELPAKAFDVPAVQNWCKFYGWSLYDGELVIDDVTDDLEYMTSGYDVTGSFPVMQVVGTSFVFNTPCDTTELKKYNGMSCTVVRRLTRDEDDTFDFGRIYKVRLENGVETDAFEDEIIFAKEDQ